MSDNTGECKCCDKLADEIERLRGLLDCLADAAGAVGISHFDTDSMPSEVVCHSLADAEARFADEERGHTQTIKERDHAEEMADKLADALATLLGVEIGEHSSGNCPWTAALEAFEERPPDSATHRETPVT